jgi:phospholipid transport system substrate-binding protein
MMLTGLALAAWVPRWLVPANAATPVEVFVSDSIEKAFGILNDTQLTKVQRREQFESFLPGVIDIRRVALFTLGRHAQTSSPAEQDAFAASFQRYAASVYQSHLAKFAGQIPRVIRSAERAPGDFVVVASLADSSPGAEKPMEISFRVSTTSGKPTLIDLGVAGVWLALEERDQFAAVLSRNNGSIPLLVSHLDTISARYE